MATATHEDLRDQIANLQKHLHDLQARAYIQAMRDGEKPDERPDVGNEWEEIIDLIEQKYAKFKGNAFADVLADMCYQHPELDELLADMHHGHDIATRDYILAMKEGKKPDIRPEITRAWKPVVEAIEHAYEKCGGDKDGMQRAITALCRTKPALEELLKSPARVEVNDLGFLPALPESAYLPPELSRGACPQLDMHISYSRAASPEAYDDIHAFTGLWAFSGVSNRRVYLPLTEDIRLYTNLMIQYCGLSTFFAKSHTASVAQSLLKRAELDFFVFADRRMTPQKLLQEMSGRTDIDSYFSLPNNEQEKIKQKIAFAGQKILYFDEFGKMLKEVLGGRNPTMSVYEQIFLSIYNCPETYSNSTIVRGMSSVFNPFITVLGSMTPPNLRVIARKGAESWQDGLFARSLFICPPKEAIRDATLTFKSRSVPGELVRDISLWHDRLGSPEIEITQETEGKDVGRPVAGFTKPLPQHECVLDPDAETAYGAYRVALRQLARSKAVPEDLAASYGRLPENAMKFAMIMASISNNNHIEIRHWAKAQELAEVLRRNLHEMYAQVNTSDNIPSKGAEIEQRIRECLQKNGAMTIRGMLDKHLKGKWSTEEVTKAVAQMTKQNELEGIHTHGTIKYRIKPNWRRYEADKIDE